MRPSKFHYIMFILMLAFMLVMSICSCTVPRMAGPTSDDLAGSPMVMTIDGPFQPSGYWPKTDATENPDYGSGLTNTECNHVMAQPSDMPPSPSYCIMCGYRPIKVTLEHNYDFIIEPFDPEKHRPISFLCDHIYVYTATPAKDSTVAYRSFDGMITTLEYRIPPDSIKVIAKQPCICLFCHDIKKCF